MDAQLKTWITSRLYRVQRAIKIGNRFYYENFMENQEPMVTEEDYLNGNMVTKADIMTVNTYKHYNKNTEKIISSLDENDMNRLITKITLLNFVHPDSSKTHDFYLNTPYSDSISSNACVLCLCCRSTFSISPENPSKEDVDLQRMSSADYHGSSPTEEYVVLSGKIFNQYHCKSYKFTVNAINIAQLCCQFHIKIFAQHQLFWKSYHERKISLSAIRFEAVCGSRTFSTHVVNDLSDLNDAQVLAAKGIIQVDDFADLPPVGQHILNKFIHYQNRFKISFIHSHASKFTTYGDALTRKLSEFEQQRSDEQEDEFTSSKKFKFD